MSALDGRAGELWEWSCSDQSVAESQSCSTKNHLCMLPYVWKTSWFLSVRMIHQTNKQTSRRSINMRHFCNQCGKIEIDFTVLFHQNDIHYVNSCTSLQFTKEFR